MIQPFVDIAGSKAGLSQTLRAIMAGNDDAAATIDGITGLTLVAFGPATFNLLASTTLTIPHNLGYVPVFLAYYYSSVSNTYTPLPLIDYGNQFDGLQNRPIATLVSAWADKTYLYLDWNGARQSPTQQVYYFIFKAAVQ